MTARIVSCGACDGEGVRYVNTGGSGTGAQLAKCDGCRGAGEIEVDERGAPVERDDEAEGCHGC